MSVFCCGVYLKPLFRLHVFRVHQKMNSCSDLEAFWIILSFPGRSRDFSTGLDSVFVASTHAVLCRSLTLLGAKSLGDFPLRYRLSAVLLQRDRFLDLFSFIYFEASREKSDIWLS